MRVLFVTSEMVPLMKTGGLGDVCGALPTALMAAGADVRVLLPAYPEAVQKATLTGEEITLGDPLGMGQTKLLVAEPVEPGDAPVWLLDCPPLFGRPGNPYSGPDGHDWPDNEARFGLLSKVGAMIGAAGGLIGWRPDIIHAHDWQAAPVAAYLRAWGIADPPVFFSIHNLQYQGWFPSSFVDRMGLPGHLFPLLGWHDAGSFSFLKAGLLFARRLSTVSPTYAREILTPDGGHGQEGVLRSRAKDLVGILNGIDRHHWDPATDHWLHANYDSGSMDGKAACKRALMQRFGLSPFEDGQEGPVFGVVSRLADQKGIDMVPEVLSDILADGRGRLVILGSGNQALEAKLAQLSRGHKGQMAMIAGYDDALSHAIFAGADAVLIPSRFEPCGLTQMYAMRYGAVPIARRTGGLNDSIIDIDAPGGGTGVLFDHALPDALAWAIGRFHALYAQPEAFQAVQARGMAQLFGWEQAGQAYLREYEATLRVPVRLSLF